MVRSGRRNACGLAKPQARRGTHDSIASSSGSYIQDTTDDYLRHQPNEPHQHGDDEGIGFAARRALEVRIRSAIAHAETGRAVATETGDHGKRDGGDQ